nr:zinc finger, CCHC-type [Tanacetum cinerariifolium]GEZ72853.1 zinc finger, CCHC-type [Tanacetum cinerariifolium]
MIELDSHLRIEESLRVQDSDKPKGNNVVGPSVVNVIVHNNSSGYNDNKGKRKYHNTKEIVKIVTLETKPIDQAQMVYGMVLSTL